MFKVVNIEDGMPTVDEARKRLLLELKKAKQQGLLCLKIIHGYGSTGVGGKLKPALHKSLSLRVKEGSIRAFVPGEKWSVFNDLSLEILNVCQVMNKDNDLEKANPGISIVLL